MLFVVILGLNVVAYLVTLLSLFLLEEVVPHDEVYRTACALIIAFIAIGLLGLGWLMEPPLFVWAISWPGVVFGWFTYKFAEF